MRSRALIMIVILTAVVAFHASGDTLTFWYAGLDQDIMYWLEAEVFPNFEDDHDVFIEHRDIGWGPARSDRLIVAMAAGTGPDVLMLGANYHVSENAMIIPLDDYVQAWADKAEIIDPLWETKRYQGHIWGVPHHGDIRGIAYNSTLFGEAGIADRPPQSWEEWIDIVRKLTRIEGDHIVQQGMQWPWSEIEYRWLALQNNSEVVDDETMISRLAEPEALEALEFMKDLRDVAQPQGYVARDWREFAQLNVAMTWGLPVTLQEAYAVGDDVGDQVRVYAPRRSLDHDPVSLSFINALAITNQAQDPHLAWKFIELLMSYDVMAGLVEHDFPYMVLRSDIIGSGFESVQRYMPLYEVIHESIPGIPGVFSSELRNQIKAPLDQVLTDQIPPLQGVNEMDRVLNLYLDELTSGN